MLNHLDLFACSTAGQMLSRIFSKKIKETTETKKCIYCLRRVKVFHDKCPHCRNKDFIYDTALSGGNIALTK
jgi:hypothetical protein